MQKYWSVFKISFQQEFTYRLNFILWRLRNVLQILIFFYLWDAVFSGTSTHIFGYNRSQIFTYAFVLIIVRSIVMSARSTDVAGQIASGELTNLLLKPIKYFYYWITRDLASKYLNIIFGVFETCVLVYILRPNLFFQPDPFYVVAFITSLIIGMFIFFNLMMLASMVPFWVPELAWGAQFLFIVVIVEFFSGALFPLDIFPSFIFETLKYTPFPYLVFVPIKIYLGGFAYGLVMQSIVIGVVWSLILWKFTNYIWKKGLRVYESVGR